MKQPFLRGYHSSRVDINKLPEGTVCKGHMGQNPVPLMNTKVAGKWMSIPL